MTKSLFFLLFLFGWTVAAAAEETTHPAVQSALQWTLPENSCVAPKMVARASNIVDGEGAREITDVDTYTIKRFEKKQKRWKNCVEQYKVNLLADFDTLKSSAQHGLTQEQADQILSKMALIQSVYVTDDGLPPPAN